MEQVRHTQTHRRTHTRTHTHTHTHTRANTHACTHTRVQIHTCAHAHTGRFTHFLFNGWHRSTCLVTYTETIMSFLAICLSSTFLLVGKVAVKSCLAVTQPVSCLQTVKMKMFHNSIVVLRIFHGQSVIHLRIFFLSNKFVDASQNRCTRFVLFGNYTHLRSHAQKSKTQRGTLYSGDETHYGPSRSLSKYGYQVIRFGKKVFFHHYTDFFSCLFSLFSLLPCGVLLCSCLDRRTYRLVVLTLPKDKVLLTTPIPNSLKFLGFKRYYIPSICF